MLGLKRPTELGLRDVSHHLLYNNFLPLLIIEPYVAHNHANNSYLILERMKKKCYWRK